MYIGQRLYENGVVLKRKIWHTITDINDSYVLTEDEFGSTCIIYIEDIGKDIFEEE